MELTLALLAGAALLYAIAIYNRLVTLRTRTREGWSDITVQLKRRYDLIPNLVETVKGYATHERTTLEAVIAARNSAASASGPAASGQNEGLLSGALRQLFALSEAYPELKANTNFMQLQSDLADTENQIQGARRYFNGAVKEYNILVEQFPSTIIARLFGFSQSEFFELPAPEAAVVAQAPKVSF